MYARSFHVLGEEGKRRGNEQGEAEEGKKK